MQSLAGISIICFGNAHHLSCRATECKIETLAGDGSRDVQRRAECNGFNNVLSENKSGTTGRVARVYINGISAIRGQRQAVQRTTVSC
jgi:hypothetical protein